MLSRIASGREQAELADAIGRADATAAGVGKARRRAPKPPPKPPLPLARGGTVRVVGLPHATGEHNGKLSLRP